MGILKHRPQVRLMVRPEIVPGETTRARVVVDAKREVPIEWVRVQIRGVQRKPTFVGSIVTLHAEPMGKGELRAGRTERPFLFTLPDWSPPSYAGRSWSVQYTASVSIGIPWWPDRHADFALNVIGGAATPPDPEPVIVSTRPDGPRANEAHVEVSLANRHVAQGGVLSGAIALGNVAYNHFDELVLSLCANEHGNGTSLSGIDAHVYTMRIPIEEAAEGQSVPFRLRVPTEAPVSMRSFGGLRVSWALRVRARVRWGNDVDMRVPITVVPRRFRTEARENRGAPPSVGSARVSKAWVAAGARHGLEFDGDALHGAIGDTTVRIQRDHRGRSGIFLVGRLLYPPLGMELSIAPSSLLGPRASEGVQFGDPSWYRAHRATCREPAQLENVAQTLGSAVSGLANVRMDDTHAIVERRTSGAARRPVAAFTDAVAHLARVVGTLSAAAGPPAAMADHAERWRALAASLSGALRESDLSISATVLGCDVAIDTSYDRDGFPTRTSIAVIKHLADRGTIAWHRDAVAAANAVPSYVRGTFDRVTRDAVEVRITDRGVVASYDCPRDDPAVVIPRVNAAAQLVVGLGAPSAPYR